MTVNTVLFLETKSVLAALKDSGAASELYPPNSATASRSCWTSIFPKTFLTSSSAEKMCNAQAVAGRAAACHQATPCHQGETLYIGDSTVDAETAQKAEWILQASRMA